MCRFDVERVRQYAYGRDSMVKIGIEVVSREGARLGRGTCVALVWCV